MTKLSFVVPVYKPDMAVLEKCVKSLIAQSLKEWEAIFVLDGANEDAGKLIARLFKKSVNHFRIVEIEHGGACRARNEGFKHAASPYVIFWDSDCAIEPHAAQAWVGIFEKNAAVGFIYSGYKFFDEKGAINSEQFDPWTLRVTNYISTCFPVRRELVGQWDESLESLQDWDFWLGVVERGGVGKFLDGHAFSTAYPTPESISGKGCTRDMWLTRMDKVREKHGIPKRDTCVTSVANKHDGIALAKILDVDYHDRPDDKPSHYKTIIQVGFGLGSATSELCASAWGPDHSKILFWTRDDIDEIYNAVALRALGEYSSRLNQACARQFVEDKASKTIMERAGFNVDVLPMPMVSDDEITPLPEQPRFLVDAAQQYGHVLAVIKRALPDFKIEAAQGIQKIEDYTGLVHFFVERTMSPSIKRMLLSGRHVVSNVQSPFAGFMEDKVTDERFIVSMVERLRKLAKTGPNSKAKDYYKTILSTDKFKEVLCGSAS